MVNDCEYMKIKYLRIHSNLKNDKHIFYVCKKMKPDFGLKMSNDHQNKCL